MSKKKTDTFACFFFVLKLYKNFIYETEIIRISAQVPLRDCWRFLWFNELERKVVRWKDNLLSFEMFNPFLRIEWSYDRFPSEFFGKLCTFFEYLFWKKKKFNWHLKGKKYTVWSWFSTVFSLIFFIIWKLKYDHKILKVVESSTFFLSMSREVNIFYENMKNFRVWRLVINWLLGRFIGEIWELFVGRRTRKKCCPN